MQRCILGAGRLSQGMRWSLLVAIVACAAPAAAQDTPAEAKPQTVAQINLQAYELSQAAKSEEEFNKVIELCQQSLELQPTAPEKKYANELLAWTYCKRGEAREDTGQNDEALADFELSLKLNPNHWMALHHRGVSHAENGNLDAALADFNRVVQLSPRFTKTLYNRGEVRFNKGDLAGAIADYTAVLRVNPRDSGAMTSRGFIYYKQRDLRSAMRDYNDALQIDPNNAEAYTLRGDLQADQAQFAQAVQDYQAAVRVNPEYGRAYQSSAWLRATSPNARFRHTDVALRNAQKAIDLEGDTDYRYLESLAAAQANAGQFEDAKATQARAIEAAKGINIPQADGNRMQERLTLYQANRPYRDVRPGAPQPRQ